MKLAARLANVEKAVGKGILNGPLCRLHLRATPPDPAAPKPKPDEACTMRCPMCGEERVLSLRLFSGDEREAQRLFPSFTPEDQYMDARAHALAFWLALRPARRHKARATRRAKQVAAYGRQPKPTPTERRCAALRAEVADFERRQDRELKAKHGEAFPAHLELVKSIFERRRVEITEAMKGYPHSTAKEIHALEDAITDLQASAEMEKIIWGGVRPATVEAEAEARAKIAELIARGEEEERERERQRAEEERQREETRRRLNEEFKRKSVNHGKPQAGLGETPAPAREHPFWNEGADEPASSPGPQPIHIPSG